MRRVSLGLSIVFVLAIIGVDAEAGRRRLNGRGFPSTQVGTEAPLPLILSDATYYDDLTLAVLPAYTAHMWSEAADAVATTQPANDGDSVGAIYDPSNSAFAARWLTAARRGVLRTDASTRSYVECRATGSNDIAQMQNSERAFNYCIGSRACTIILWAGTIANGTTQILVDSTNASAAASALGFSVFKNTSNQIVFYNSNGAGGASCNVNSGAATLLAASGIVPIGIRVSGTTVEFNVGAAAEVGATCASAGTTGTMTYPVTICGSGATTGSADVNFGGLMVFDRRLTDAEYAAVVADYTGVRSSRSLVIDRPAPYFFNFLSTYYDYTDPTTIFEDAGATDPAEVPDAIAVVRDPRDLTNTWNRGATSTVAAAPQWRGALGAHWSGSGSQALVWPQWTMDAGRTVVIRALNEDATNGSHVLQGGSYVPITGADYSSNPGGAAYFTVHPASGAVTGSSLVTETGYNDIEIRRSGTNWYASVGGQNATSDSSSAQWTPTNTGRPGSDALTAWRMQGYVERMARYNVALTDAQLATVRTGWAALDETWSNTSGVRRTSGGTYMTLTVNSGDALDSQDKTVCAWAAIDSNDVDFDGLAWRQVGSGVGQEPFYLLMDPLFYCAGGAQTWTFGIGQQGHGVGATCDTFVNDLTPQFVCGRYLHSDTSTRGEGSVFVNGVDATYRYSTGLAVPATPGNEVPPTIAPITAEMRVAGIRGGTGLGSMDSLMYFNCALSDDEIRDIYCATGGSGATCTGVTARASSAVRGNACFVDLWRFDNTASLGLSETGLHDLTNGGNAEAAPSLP